MDWLIFCAPVPVLLVIALFAFTKAQRAILFRRADAKCENCGVDWNDGYMLHADHIKPEALGGGDGLDNGQMLCVPCHREKHANDAYEAKKRGDTRAEKVNEYAVRQLNKRSIWRRGFEARENK